MPIYFLECSDFVHFSLFDLIDGLLQHLPDSAYQSPHIVVLDVLRELFEEAIQVLFVFNELCWLHAWLITVSAQPYLCDFKQKGIVESILFVHPEQGAYAVGRFVELFQRDAISDAVMPQLPLATIKFEPLLCARKCLFELLLHRVAIRNVAPSIGLLLVNGHNIPEGENCLIKLLQTHVRTSTSKPGVLV